MTVARDRASHDFIHIRVEDGHERYASQRTPSSVGRRPNRWAETVSCLVGSVERATVVRRLATTALRPPPTTRDDTEKRRNRSRADERRLSHLGDADLLAPESRSG